MEIGKRKVCLKNKQTKDENLVTKSCARENGQEWGGTGVGDPVNSYRPWDEPTVSTLVPR